MKLYTYLTNDELEIGKVSLTMKYIATIVEFMEVLHTASVDDEFLVKTKLFPMIGTVLPQTIR